MSDNAYINDLETRLGEANARITALEAELAEAKENANVSRHVADAFGETLCKIAGTTDRIAACVIASDKFAAMQTQLTAALATVEKCKAAGFVDERGEVVKYRMTYWPEDSEDSGYEDPSEIADNLNLGDVFAVVPGIILPEQYFVATADDKGCSDTRPADAEEVAAFKRGRDEWKQRRDAEFAAINANVQSARAVPIPTPSAAAAAKGGGQ